MLRIKNVNKFYGKFHAIKDFSINIEEGQIYGIIGPNGAGKTTIFKIIATILSKTSGTIILNDREYRRKNINKIREEIGYMPDFFGVYDNLKVIEYMDFYCDLADIPKKDKSMTINEALSTVYLTNKSNEYVNDLSRGMKQRLCLARALITDPKFLILDEPSSGMDPVSRAKMKEILNRLKQEGKTILISSHILNDLSDICSHLVILDDGEIVIEGAIDDILNKLKGEEVIVVEVLEEELVNSDIIKNFTGVKDVYIKDNSYHIVFNGDRHRKSMLLRYLIDNGIPIVTFKNQVSDIEDIYNRVTMGGQSDES